MGDARGRDVKEIVGCCEKSQARRNCTKVKKKKKRQELKLERNKNKKLYIFFFI